MLFYYECLWALWLFLITFAVFIEFYVVSGWFRFHAIFNMMNSLLQRLRANMMNLLWSVLESFYYNKIDFNDFNFGKWCFIFHDINLLFLFEYFSHLAYTLSKRISFRRKFAFVHHIFWRDEKEEIIAQITLISIDKHVKEIASWNYETFGFNLNHFTSN